MHNKMAEKVLRADILFFDSNPIGRITTRFSKDMTIIDIMLPNATVFVTQGIMRSLTVVVTVSMVNPWLLIVVAVSLVYMYYITSLGIKPMVDSQRFDQQFTGPINTTFSMVISGMTTLRSYR